MLKSALAQVFPETAAPLPGGHSQVRVREGIYMIVSRSGQNSGPGGRPVPLFRFQLQEISSASDYR